MFSGKGPLSADTKPRPGPMAQSQAGAGAGGAGPIGPSARTAGAGRLRALDRHQAPRRSCSFSSHFYCLFPIRCVQTRELG